MTDSDSKCQRCGLYGNIVAHNESFTTYECVLCKAIWAEPNKQSKKTDNDAVSHPKHYANGMTTEVECIMFTRWMSFDIGNAFKYVWRAGHKDDFTQELDKALWYLEDAMEYEIKEKHLEFISFLPKSSLEDWKYRTLCAILCGDYESAATMIRNQKSMGIRQH
jgi:hypothetical protein